MNTKTRQGTRAVWAGEEQYLLGATQVPVVLSTAFGYKDMDEWLAVATGKAEGHIYTRNSNPTIHVFEEKVRLLEDAEAATSAASGMGIISSTLFALLASGNRVVSEKDTYGGTSAIFNEYMPKYQIDTVQADTADHDQIEAEIAKGCTLLYLETPTNPTTKIIDIARLSKVAYAQGAVVVVDNTAATPINQNPLQLGADVVVHSATKFLGGHADALGGVACGSKHLIDIPQAGGLARPEKQIPMIITMWLLYSGNFSLDENDEPLKVNPPGGHYGIALQKIQLITGK